MQVEWLGLKGAVNGLSVLRGETRGAETSSQWY